jgi:hypothetical protein
MKSETLDRIVKVSDVALPVMWFLFAVYMAIACYGAGERNGMVLSFLLLLVYAAGEKMNRDTSRLLDRAMAGWDEALAGWQRASSARHKFATDVWQELEGIRARAPEYQNGQPLDNTTAK